MINWLFVLASMSGCYSGGPNETDEVKEQNDFPTDFSEDAIGEESCLSSDSFCINNLLSCFSSSTRLLCDYLLLALI